MFDVLGLGKNLKLIEKAYCLMYRNLSLAKRTLNVYFPYLVFREELKASGTVNVRCFWLRENLQLIEKKLFGV